MQPPNKYAFSQSLTEELQRRAIYVAHLRDAVLPGPPPGAWVYRLLGERNDSMETICHLVIYELIGSPGSLVCIHPYADGESTEDIGKIRAAINRAFNYVQYADAPK